MTVGERIKNRRKELGLSAEIVAERIGVSPATVYRYESADIMNMRIDKIAPIARALNTTPAYLMGWTDNSGLSDPNSKATVTRPKLDILFSRSRALTDKQLDIVMSIVDEMTKEQDGNVPE